MAAEAVAPPAVPSRFLYASAYAGPNTFPASIYGFAVYTDGALSPVPGSPVPTSNGGGPIAITRDSKLLYTTNFFGPTGSGELLAGLSLFESLTLSVSCAAS